MVQSKQLILLRWASVELHLQLRVLLWSIHVVLGGGGGQCAVVKGMCRGEGCWIRGVIMSKGCG